MSEDKVTYTFVNPAPDLVDDKEYAKFIETYYEIMSTTASVVKNPGAFSEAIYDLIERGDASKLFTLISIIIVSISERLENIDKSESRAAVCDVVEEHNIVCVINKDVAMIAEPGYIDALFRSVFTMVDKDRQLIDAIKKIDAILDRIFPRGEESGKEKRTM